MTLDTTIVNIKGNLRDAYKAAIPGTLRHVDELMNERRTNPTSEDGVDLCNLCFYTADGEVYSVDNGTPTLRMTRGADNPVLNHIDDAFIPLTTEGNYRVLPADFEAVKTAPDTVTIDLTKLRLKGDDAEWRYLEISTTGYEALDTEERKLAERVYGQGNDFALNMEMLSDADIKTTRVYVLNPDYVRRNAVKAPVARASWLDNFDDDSSFYADVRSIDDYNRVRGVRRGLAEGAREGKVLQ